jgi:thiamine monophosphate kinase
MRLSEAGELGLLAELERRGLARGIEHDAAALEDGLVVTQDALVEDVHFRGPGRPSASSATGPP